MTRLGISVVIPTFNRFNMLREAVDSCLEQTLLPSQIIICDNGSTDQTLQFNWPDSVNLVKETRRGAGAARKRGLSHATAELVFFLDSDDILVPNALETLGELMGDKSIHLSHGSVCNFHDTEVRGDRALQSPIRSPLASTSLIRRSAFDVFGNFDDDNYSFARWVMTSIDSGLELIATDAVISHRRIHDSNVGRDPDSKRFYLNLARERIANARR